VGRGKARERKNTRHSLSQGRKKTEESLVENPSSIRRWFCDHPLFAGKHTWWRILYSTTSCNPDWFFLIWLNFNSHPPSSFLSYSSSFLLFDFEKQ
jgi:hypothetical protein